MNDHNSYNPYSDPNYQRSAYPTYTQTYGANYSYHQGYTTDQYGNTAPTATDRSGYSTQNWEYAQSQQPAMNTSGQNQEDAVANEMKQQKAQLHKQREDYVKKVIVLRRELDLLRDQKHELMGSKSPPRDLDTIIKENEKLQDEIQTKMKAITNVIEMLSSIIKDGQTLTDLEHLLKEESPKRNRNDKSPTSSSGVSKTKSFETHTHFNYVHYDPELHWCRMCDKFPKTAKEFLLHLQCKKHQENIQENDVGDNTPWHKLPAEPELPHYDGAPKKRIPIKGLQFFISAPSWYCKLCDVWIGDLHCASQHLKSQVHFQNYQNFIEQNPHWEMEWLKDREKALSRADKRDSSDSDNSTTSKKKRKKKDKKSTDNSSKDKKKKKRGKKHKRQSSDSSSSSSSSPSSSDNEAEDKSRSIRVAMRNVKAETIMKEDLTEKWEMLGRLVEEHKKKTAQEEKEKKEKEVRREASDTLINQWMNVQEPPEKEKYLLDSLKDRMKQKTSLERAKYLEMERKQKEKEQKEKEENEKKQREENEELERKERERKERERLEYERIIDKERSQVKFKTVSKDKQNRRNVSRSPSPDRGQGRDRDRDYDNRSRREKRRSRSPEERNSSEKYKRYSRDRNGNSRSRSPSRGAERRSRKSEEKSSEKKSGPPSFKKLPFIGRMPLFKNKKPDSDRVEKEIQKEEYEPVRITRFEPGHLSRAFIPAPAVVCFPKLSSFPEITLPPPAPPTLQPTPPAPKITEEPKEAPPAPKIEKELEKEEIEPPQDTFGNEDFDPNMYEEPSQLWQDNTGYENMYPPYTNYEGVNESSVPISHMMPLQPPPMPPGEDDLALLGISADDMAAQTF